MAMVSHSRQGAGQSGSRNSACEKVGSAVSGGVRFVASLAWDTNWAFWSNFGSWTWLRAGKIGGEVVIGLLQPSLGWRTAIRGLASPLGLAAVSAEIGFTGATVDTVFDGTRHAINHGLEKCFGTKDYLYTVYSPVTQPLLTVAYTVSAFKGTWDDIAAAIEGDPRDAGVLSYESGSLYPFRAAFAAAIAVFLGFAWAYWRGSPKSPPPTASFDDYMNLAAARVRGAQNGVMRPDVQVSLFFGAVFTAGDSGLLLKCHPLVPKIVGSLLAAYGIYAICFDWYSQSRLFVKGAKPAEFPKARKDLLLKLGMPKTADFLENEIFAQRHDRQQFPASWLRMGAGLVSFFLWQMWLQSLKAQSKSLKPGEGMYVEMLNSTLTQQVASFIGEWALQGVVLLRAMKPTDGKDPDGDKRRAAARLTLATALGAAAECLVRYTAISGAGARGALEGLAGGALMRATPHVVKRGKEAYRWCKGDREPAAAEDDRKGPLAPADEFEEPPTWLQPFRELAEELMYPIVAIYEMSRGSICGATPVETDGVRAVLRNAAGPLQALANAVRDDAPSEILVQLATHGRGVPEAPPLLPPQNPRQEPPQPASARALSNESKKPAAARTLDAEPGLPPPGR